MGKELFMFVALSKSALTIGLLGAAVASTATPVMIFDGSTLVRDASGNFGTDSGALGRYSFAAPTTISSFSTLLALSSESTLTFRIYDSTTGAALYTSAAKAFAADATPTVEGATFKHSDAFSFTFNVGTIYAVGAVSSSAPLVIGSFSTKTENGISALLGNQNVMNNAFSTSSACCAVAAQFFGTVPEPMTWSMMIIGFGIVGTAARRQYRATVSHS